MDGHSSGLGVGGDAGHAVVLDVKVVGVHLHAEEAVLAPVGAPGVAADPELNAVLNAVADHRDFVVDEAACLLRVNAASVVVVEVVRAVDAA